MQSNSAAFEGWALLIHVYCKFQVELDLDLEHAPSGQPARGHYQRFLYRALKFSQQYSSWFSLSERLAPRVEQFRQYLYHGGSPAHPNPTFCNGLPSKPAKDGTSLESCVEGLFAGECRSVLTELTFQQAGISLIPDCVHRQLPVGLYETEKSEQNSVFPYGKSAVDLWALTTDGVVIYELKTRNPMVGLLTELMFYANYMYDLYAARNTEMQPTPPAAPKEKQIADSRPNPAGLRAAVRRLPCRTEHRNHPCRHAHGPAPLSHRAGNPGAARIDEHGESPYPVLRPPLRAWGRTAVPAIPGEAYDDPSSSPREETRSGEI